MPQARVTWPNARVMADGRVRIPAAQAAVIAVNGEALVEWQANSGWEVEPIPDPEPKWNDWDVVRDANGVPFVRLPNGRWDDITGMHLQPVRPLTKLVPA